MHRALLMAFGLALTACPGPIADCFCGPGSLGLDVPLVGDEVALGIAPAGCRHITRVPFREQTGRLNGPFVVKNVTTSNPRFQVGMQETVPGGALVFLNVVTDVPVGATADLTANVTIETNLQTLEFPVRLRVGRHEDVVPALDFGGAQLGVVSSLSFDVSHIDPLGSGRGVSKMMGEGFDSATVDQRAMQVRFLPTRAGRFSGQFSIDALRCEGRDVVRFVGDGVDEIVSPRTVTIDFGDVALGTHVTRTVMVSSLAPVSVPLMQDSPSRPFIVVSEHDALLPATRDAGGALVPGSTPITVLFSPSSVGPASRTIRLWGSALQSPVAIDLMLTGAGVP